MSKRIEDLPGDILDLLQSQKRNTPEEIADKMTAFATAQGLLLNRALTQRDGERKPKTLYASELGKRCKRQLWYAHNTPTLVEPLPSKTKFKFMYGDMIEEAVLTLAEFAGHTVEDRQKTVEHIHESGWKVRGRQDALIDGVLVDVKSSSPFGMKKFAEGLNDTNDTFGYRQQLSFYNGVSFPDYKRQGFVAVDKQNGDIDWRESPWITTKPNLEDAIEAIESPDEPSRIVNAEEDASFRNRKLTTECSYCPYKRVCWRSSNSGAGLLMAAYANQPVWLTQVFKAPAVPVHYQGAPANAEEVIRKVSDEKDSGT
jgi:hypothetical protein